MYESNSTVLESFCELLKDSNLDKSCLGEAVEHADYLQIRAALAPLNMKTPYEWLLGDKLDGSVIRDFRCTS